MNTKSTPLSNPRLLAFLALRAIQQGAYADVTLDRLLVRWQGNAADRRLATELVYGTVRRQKTLDALITQLSRKKQAHPPDLRWILHLGLYQLRYLTHIPSSAAVNTTVDLAKQQGFAGLSGFVNALLRHYVRQAEQGDPLHLPDDPVERLAVQHSFPEWMVQVWLTQLPMTEVEQLCHWLNQVPHLDLRVNPLRADRTQVIEAFAAQGMAVLPLDGLPQAVRVNSTVGAIWHLPGFNEGWWSVQDSSAQLVSHIVNPQPSEVVIDACAAPGGKTTHLAELMGDRGTIWGCDRYASRLKKLQSNATRLGLTSIQIRTDDSRTIEFDQPADRVLLDVPCSGLGTLHRHADARWRQTPDTVMELVRLQQALLNHCATWVKPGGILVYSTCTLHPDENEGVVRQFLAQNPQWHIVSPAADTFWAQFATPEGWLKIIPHRHNMDGFFVAQLQNSASE